MKVTYENTSVLCDMELQNLKMTIDALLPYGETPSEWAAKIERATQFFVYKGGHHLAVLPHDGCPVRIALITF